jgi:ABC-2 type transport system ATP-binding protein
MDSYNSKELIKFQNVSKNYKHLTALDKISFTINKGDVFGYIGPNGAGKTTTIKIIVGLIKDYLGNIYFNGEDITKNHHQIHRFVGYHPQDAGFQEWRTINHVMSTFGLLSGLKSGFLKERIHNTLDFVSLLGECDKRVKYLSSGMLQKLRLAQALLTKPEILILDEPLSGLDPSSRYQIKNLIRKLSKEGKTILFSSHILSDVQDIANKVGIINRGKILRIGTPKELQSEFNIGNEIEIEYANATQKLTDIESLDCIQNIDSVASNKQILRLKPEMDLDNAINQILNYIIQNKLKIRTFKNIKPSLEDVYLRYIRGDFQ